MRLAAVEAVEQRVLLSASLQYIPFDATGQPGTPVTFESSVGQSVEDFAPPERSLLAQGFAAPKFDVFLGVDGVAGDSLDEKHKGTIEIESFSWGVSQTSLGGGGGGAGKVNYQDLHFTSSINKASPLLMKAAATGKHIKEADLFVRTQDGKQFEFLTVTLQDVLISSYQVHSGGDGGGAAGGDTSAPTEEFSLNFTKIEFKYTPQNADGSVGNPVVFQPDINTGGPTFVPAQRSLLDEGGAPAQAASDYFLQLDGVTGDSADHKHKDWIDIDSFSWGVSQTAGAPGGGVPGASSFEQLHVTSRLSSASPQLAARMATGRHIPQAILTVRKQGTDQADYYTITLQDVLVSSYQLRTDAAGLVEEYTFSFAGAQEAYTPLNVDGFPTGNPIVFDSGPDPVSVEKYSPERRSVIDAGAADPQAVDFFLQIEGVQGESADRGHKDWIDILSVGWGGDGVPDVAGTPSSFDALHVVTRASSASPQLLADLSNGVPASTSTLVARQSGGDLTEFFRIDLTDVLVSSYRATSAADGTLLEEYTLNFDSVKEQFVPPPIPGVPPPEPVIFESGPGVQVRPFSPPEPALLTDHGGPVASKFDAFLSIGGIEGESTDDKHKGEIDIESFSWGATQTPSSTPGGAGKVSYQDLHFTSTVNKASPLLMRQAATGTHIPQAILSVRREAASDDFYQIKLEDVLVSSYQVAPGQGGQLEEEFTLSFDTAEQVVQGPAGTPPQSYKTPAGEAGVFAPVQRSLLQDGYYTLGAATDMFLKVDGIDGESADDKHKGEIEILSYSWGVTQTGATSGGGAGKATMQDIHFVSNISKASPLLMKSCATGQHIPKATLSLVRTGKVALEYLTVTLEDVLVSSHQFEQFGDGSVREEFTLTAAKSTEQYVPQNADGSTGDAVTFATPQGIEVQPFAAPQSSLIDLGRLSSGPADLFLDVDGVEGGSTDDKHKGEIEIQSFSWGVTQTGAFSSGGGGGAGRASFQDIHVVSKLNAASPQLMQRLAAGKHIPSAVLTLRRGDGTGQEPLTIKLEDVLISSYQLTTAPDGTPLEEFTLHFAEVTAPTLSSTTIGDGTAQRSMVRSVSFTFDRPVAMGDGSVRLALLNTGGSGANDGSPPTDVSAALAAQPTTPDNGITWVFTFTPGTTYVHPGGSLVDGIYRVSIDPTKVSAGGVTMAAAPAPVTFHRLFGDGNGSKSVNLADYGAFRLSFGKPSTDPAFNPAFDFDGNGSVNLADYGQFRSRFGKAFDYA